MSKERRKLCLALVVVFTVNLLVIAVAQSVAAQTYKKGSSGQTVTQIQTKLRDWGYYSGAVDGVYGTGTETAVKKFQRKNGQIGRASWRERGDVSV